MGRVKPDGLPDDPRDDVVFQSGLFVARCDKCPQWYYQRDRLILARNLALRHSGKNPGHETCVIDIVKLAVVNRYKTVSLPFDGNPPF